MIYFVSDLHLSPAGPGALRLFLDFLEGRARSAEHLFILGDLFDFWLGDDGIDDPENPVNRQVVDGLRRLTRSGVKLSLMHGNRDFLLGGVFARQTGAEALPDPYLLRRPEASFVLSHGDMLCTDDADYQRLRAYVRNPATQVDYLNRPLAERKAISADLRRQSEAAKRQKIEHAMHDIMDVNLAATEEFLRLNGYATFIHGHTHRPATHTHLIDGVRVERWVLSDWSEDRGEIVSWDGHRLQREILEGGEESREK